MKKDTGASSQTSSGEQKAESKPEQQTATPQSNIGSQPEPTPQPEPAPQPTPQPEPAPQPPAHVHNFNIPITEQRPEMQQVDVWYCNTCRADISNDPGGHLDETMHGGYHYVLELRPTGNMISETVGWQCSCGAVQ